MKQISKKPMGAIRLSQYWNRDADGNKEDTIKTKTEKMLQMTSMNHLADVF
jgi:hypothetical protein